MLVESDSSTGTAAEVSLSSQLIINFGLHVFVSVRFKWKCGFRNYCLGEIVEVKLINSQKQLLLYIEVIGYYKNINLRTKQYLEA